MALSLLASFFVIPVIFLLAWLLTVSTHPRLAATRLPKRPLPRHDNEGGRSSPKPKPAIVPHDRRTGMGRDSVDPFSAAIRISPGKRGNPPYMRRQFPSC